MACPERGLPLCGGDYTHDAFDGPGGDAGRLRPDSLGERATRTRRGHQTRPEKRHPADHYHCRDRIRLSHRRTGRHRNGLHAEWHWAFYGRRHCASGYPGSADAGAAHCRRLCGGQPHRRSAVCLARSAHQLPLKEGEMAVATRPTPTVQSKSVRNVPSSPFWGVIYKFMRTKPLGAAGAAIIVLMALAAIGADFIAPYDVYTINPQLQFSPPSLAHWLGTDEFGRDVLTRIIYGARIALFIGFASSLLGATAGAVVGVCSAYVGGKTDLWLQRLMDILLAFPLLVLALAIVTVLGRTIPNLIVAIAMPMIPRTARIVRVVAIAIPMIPRT